MLDDDGPKDKNRFLNYVEEPVRTSLLNEPIAFRDTGDATVLRPWPKARPLHAVIPCQCGVVAGAVGGWGQGGG
jgi:hypothetical protein